MAYKRKVVVVGGGLMGASVAWHLAKTGAEVTVVEAAPRSETTATALSFGWVGASASTPSDDPQGFAQRLQAIGEFLRLERELGSLPVAARGAMVWGATPQDTQAMLAEHSAAGAAMQCLTRTQIGKMEPSLALPPELAAWAPDDFAVEPQQLAALLLAGAQAHGAAYREAQVQAIESQGGQVTGVRGPGWCLGADAVVLANGVGAQPLALALDVTLPVRQAPAVLMRFDMAQAPIAHLLCAQDLELRPGHRGALVSAADYPIEGEAGLQALAADTGHAIARLLGLARPPALRSIHAVQRPMTVDGTALCGPVSQLQGLYALVAHPGVMLAPRLGRLCAEAVLG